MRSLVKIKFIVCFLCGFQLGATHLQMNLQKALDKKLVEAKVTSLGGYQGFCIRMNLKNLSKDSLIITVEAGRRLNSIDDKNQDILVVKQEIIALRTKEEKGFNVKGYCCQASNHSPPMGAKYHINTLADTNLVKLARLLNFKEFDKNAEQEAIWAISDKRSSANISSENDSLTQGLREMVAMLKGEELPWYRILSKKYVFENGAISIINLRLQGLISYSNDKENYATLSVKNEKGLEVCQVKSEWIKISTNQIYKLDLPIKGLPKGKYSIELSTTEKQLAKREFEI